MHASDTVQRVRVYLSESDEIGGRPRYLAALELLRESGATGATAVRGVAGFGISQQLRSAQGDSGRMPIVIDWIDRTERVARILPGLEALMPDALITLEDVKVYRATLRSGGPFGERSVSELAEQDVITIEQGQSIADAIRLLLQRDQVSLPVLDEQRRLVGLVGPGELRRQQLPSKALLALQTAASREELLAPLESTKLSDSVTAEVLALAADSSILQAAKAMVEWGLDVVPVVARDGSFFGMFGIDQALQAAEETRTAGEGAIRTAEQPATLGVLMQGVFQTVLGYAGAAEGFERLLGVGDMPLVVVDNGRPLGLLDYGFVLAHSEIPQRERLTSLQPGAKTNRAALLDIFGEIRVASLPLVPLPTLPLAATYDRAIAVLRETGVPWLAAVDDQGKLQGLVGRRTLLRALVQESST